MPRLSSRDRQRPVGRLEAGELPQQAAIALGVHISTIYLSQNRFHTTDTTDDLPESDRPRVTIDAQYRYIL